MAAPRNRMFNRNQFLLGTFASIYHPVGIPMLAAGQADRWMDRDPVVHDPANLLVTVRRNVSRQLRVRPDARQCRRSLPHACNLALNKLDPNCRRLILRKPAGCEIAHIRRANCRAGCTGACRCCRSDVPRTASMRGSQP